MKLTAPPDYIASILKRLESKGFAGYLVGGCVRDAVMDRPIHDWDLATSATPADVAILFPKTVLTGEKFGTVTVVLPECSVEVTTFRAEKDYKDGRRPINVEFISGIEKDLSRRDFTMNAMAESIDGELIDPFGGADDIQNKIIRCVGGPNTRFSEDALRMFRALRFSAVLGFSIENETLQAIYANAGSANKISAERIHTELEKTLMSERPQTAGEMIKLGLLEKYVQISGKCPGGLEKINLLPEESTLRWCVFCALLIEEGFIKSASKFLHEMHLDKKTIKTCSKALEVFDVSSGKPAIKKLLSKNDADIVRCVAAISDVFGIGDTFTLEYTDKIISGNECYTLESLAVNGKDLLEKGYKPGPEIGRRLNELLDHVINNPEDNTREKLFELLTIAES